MTSSTLSALAVSVVSGVLATAVVVGIGYVVRKSATPLRAHQQRLLRRRLLALRHPSGVHDWLVEYYSSRSSEQDLYLFEDADGSSWRSPLLMRRSWNLPIGSSGEDLLIQSTPQLISNVKVNRRVLARKGKHLALTSSDGEPWNELIASVTRVEETDAGPRIHIQTAQYYQYLSACGPLEYETYRAARARTTLGRRRTPLRDSSLASLDVADGCLLGAQPLGMQVAVVFNLGGDYRVLIQRRAADLSLYAGALAVVPVFGCQTTDLSADTEVDLFHNYLRETFEELYGGVEVQHRGRHADPTWFYSEPAVARLIRARSLGALQWHVLGFGFETLNGEIDLMACAVYVDSKFAQTEWSAIQANWEIEHMKSWDLFGSELTGAIMAGEFSGGSAYAIARARDLLKRGGSEFV